MATKMMHNHFESSVVYKNTPCSKAQQ